MNRFKTGLMAICILSILSIGVFASAQDKMLKEHFEFSNDVMVGNTLIKKGHYLVKYNTETGMMTLTDANNHKKILATAKATVKMNEKDFEKDEILTKEVSGKEYLTTLRLGGQKEELTLTENVASSN